MGGDADTGFAVINYALEKSIVMVSCEVLLFY
jgi:hypothetical protein